jgi:hypothetical protein
MFHIQYIIRDVRPRTVGRSLPHTPLSGRGMFSTHNLP